MVRGVTVARRLSLGSLPEGGWRWLSEDELREGLVLGVVSQELVVRSGGVRVQRLQFS